MYSLDVPTTINTVDYNVAFIRSDQDLIDSEKYNHWINQSDVVNPDTYSLVQYSYITNPFTAYFEPVAEVTFNTTIENQTNSVISLKDPWFIDNTVTYATITSPVNRGTDAIFHELQTPITLDENSDYKGVFLNQNDQFQAGIPTYSLRAPRLIADDENIGVFEKWVAYEDDGTTEDTEGDWAEFEDEEDYDDCKVVFKQSGVVIKAEYIAANQVDESVITIGATEELSIPAGANIEMAGEVVINVDGVLNILGTEENPVELICEGVGHAQFLPLIRVRENGFLQISHTLLEFTNISTRPNIICDDGSEAHFEHVNIITNKTALKIEDALVTYNYGVISTDRDNSSVEMIDIDLSLTSTDISFDHLTIDGASNGTGINANFIGQNFVKTARYITIDNSIINDFATGVHYETDEWNSLLKITYCLLDNTTNFSGYPDRQNLIEGEDPLLLSGYSLNQNSPCIDEGDPNSPDDPDGTRADMGANYYDAVPSAPTNFTISGNIGQHPTINWTLCTDSDIAEYEIWRKLTDYGSQYYLRATVSNSTDQYIDTELTIAAGGKFVPNACYKVRAVDNIDQMSTFTNSLCKPYGAVGKMAAELLPQEYILHTNYPNPFNPTTTLSFDLPEISTVKLVVYDLQGREVSRVVDQQMNAGYHKRIWGGKNNLSQSVPTGVYICRMSAVSTESNQQFTQSLKMILLK